MTVYDTYLRLYLRLDFVSFNHYLELLLLKKMTDLIHLKYGGEII